MIFLGREISSQRDYSEKVAEEIDAEVAKLIEGGRRQALEILTEHRDKLDKLVVELLKTETMEREQFEKLMNEA
jgi:cell division protease FtsH